MRKYLLMLVLMMCTLPAFGQCTLTGNYTINNQPSRDCIPFSTGIFNKQLPNAGLGGPTNHLFPNSDAIIANTMGTVFAGLGYMVAAGPNNYVGDALGEPIYYGTASDPIYKVTSCSLNVGDNYPSLYPQWNPIGKTFHIPNKAMPGNVDPTTGIGTCHDSFMVVWDQTSNQVLSVYNGCGGNIGLQNCTATTTATACATPTWRSCDVANFSTDKGYQVVPGGTGAGDVPGWALTIRTNEWMQGQINHAIYLNTACLASTAWYFPQQTGTAAPCSSLGMSGTNRPFQGNLVFLDLTDAQIAALNPPAWQKPILIAMAHYGGYIGDTNQGNGNINPSRIESNQAYAQAGTVSPLYAWLEGQAGVSKNQVTTGVYQYSMSAFSVNGVSIASHLHIADPCVPLGMAGLSGGCTSVAPPPPPVLTYTIAYDITHEPPASNRPYPTAYYNQKLPNAGLGGPTDRLMPNSANLISTALAPNGTLITLGTTWHTPGTDDGQAAPLYYGQSTDPLYTLSGCTTWPSANGVTFHGPSGAPYSYATWDSGIYVWDQVSNKVIALYAGTTPGMTLPSGGGTIIAHGGYCSAENWLTSSGVNGGSGASTAGLAPMGVRIRLTEVLDVHHFNHGLGGQLACDDTNNGLYPSMRVWPATESAGFHGQTCASIGVSSTNRMPNGSLIFADYTQAELDCFDPDKAACGGIAKLQRWQFPYIEAMTLYGSTMEETGTGTGIGNKGLVGLTSYEWENTHGFPNHKIQDLINYMAINCIAPNCTVTTRSAPHSLYQWNLNIWAGISDVRGTGIIGHLHVADPCVPRGMQGLSGGCASPTPISSTPPPPTGLTITIH